MKRIKTLSIALWVNAALLLAGPVSLALAAKKSKDLEPSTPIMAYVCALVALAGICLVAFRTPTRSKARET